MFEKPSAFIGIDLPDLIKHKHPATRAILRDNLKINFDEWAYNIGDGIVPQQASSLSYVVAIDGPQGLAGAPEKTMRLCERQLGAAGKASYDFPLPPNIYAGFIKGSVKLFYSFFKSGRFHLYGLSGIDRTHANLLEVYPGSAWTVLAKDKLPKKKLMEGRRTRYVILSEKGILFPSKYDWNRLPTHDMLDAALAAFIAYLFWKGRTCDYGEPAFEDKKAAILREGLIVQPLK